MLELPFIVIPTGPVFANIFFVLPLRLKSGSIFENVVFRLDVYYFGPYIHTYKLYIHCLHMPIHIGSQRGWCLNPLVTELKNK